MVAILALFDHDLVLSDGQGGGGLNEEIALLWSAVAKDGRLGEGRLQLGLLLGGLGVRDVLLLVG